MTIIEVKEELKKATNPVAKSLLHGEGFKVLVVGFNKGMILKEHKTNLRTILTVFEGSVLYKQEDKIVELKQYEEIEIPTGILHSVEATESSLCVLIQGG